MDLLIGPLKLFLFLQITLHILQNSAFRNPFVPAGTEMPKSLASGNNQSEITEFIQSNCLLFVPPTVMNKVFNLFILDAYLNTLQRQISLFKNE